MTVKKGAGLKVSKPDGSDVEEIAPEPLPRGHPNRYRVLLPLVVSLEEGSYAQGEEFTHQFTPEDEWENLNSGLLLLLPNRYEAIGSCDLMPSLMELNPPEVSATDPQRERVEPGGFFEAAVPLAREEQLIYHIRYIPQQEK